MRHGFISVSEILDSWMVRVGEHQDQITVEQLLEPAESGANRINIRTQLANCMAIIPVKNFVGFLPSNFATVIQAAFRFDRKGRKSLREKVVSWKKGMLNGCDVELHLKCPKCHVEECDCSSEVVRVEVNRVWEAANPQLYTHYINTFRGYGNLTARGDKMCTYDDDFMLMSYKQNRFGMAPYHIGNCINVNLDCHIEYEIDIPHILCTIEEGEILLSYAGWRTDKNGIRMVPDNEYVRDAIIKWIEMELAYSDWRRHKNQGTERFYFQVRELAIKAMNLAKYKMKGVEQDEWLAFLDNHWRKLIPYTTWRSNLGRRAPDQFRYPRQSYN